jgi:Pyruvate/2-oxoacid:ferredoxin oxidoreductase delta subunit
MADKAIPTALRPEIKRKDRHAGARAFLAEARNTPDFSWFDTAHGYVYIRWPYLYISIALGEHWLARAYMWLRSVFSPLGKALRKLTPSKENGPQAEGTFADGYHGKVLPLDSAMQLVAVNEEIELRNLDNIIPFDVARDLVLKNPDHIVVLDCPCRSSRENGCQPLDVCLVVGEPFASFAAENHPLRSRWIDAQEAASILESVHERGHVHHAFFKDAMFGRFYAICNCCPCCCGAMQANRHGTPMSISSGYVSQLDEGACSDCETCVEACPYSAIAAQNGSIRIDQAICMGCGVCVSTCDQEALALVRDPSKPEPLIITELMRQATSS